MSKVLTIAVAVYNIEKYLDKCLASFADDRLKDDLEVLIINDGSKDSSQSIAEKYVEKYPSIFKLINKENGGYGTTFPVGFSNATGKYYKVVDGDDYVDTDALCELLDTLKGIDTDIIISHESRFDDQTVNKPLLSKYDSGHLSFNKEYPITVLDEKSNCWLITNIVYKTSLLVDNNIQVGNRYYVDIEYDIYPLYFAKTILFLDISITQYRFNQTGNSTNAQNVGKFANQWMEVGKRVLDYYENHRELGNEVDSFIKKWISFMISQVFYSLLLKQFSLSTYKEFFAYSKMVKSKYSEVISKGSLKTKIISRFGFLYPIFVLSLRVLLIFK